MIGGFWMQSGDEIALPEVQRAKRIGAKETQPEAFCDLP